MDLEQEKMSGTTVEDSALQENQQQEENHEDSQDNYEYVLDEHGNIIIRDRKEEKGTPTEEQPALYTQDELRDTPYDNLDPKRLPPEMLAWYKSMQTPILRKNQELAEQKRQFEQQMAQFQAQLQQAQQQTQQQQTTAQPPENMQKVYYEQLFGLAKKNVEGAFGEQFDELNPMHQTALVDEIANIKVRIIEQQNREKAVKNVVGSYAQDPEWQNIDKFALELLNNLPYQQSHNIRSRIEGGDISFLNDFLKFAKTEYYKIRNGGTQQQAQTQIQRAKPPVLETGGQGLVKNEQPQFDPRQLGKMSTDQQAKIFDKLGLIDL